MKKVIIGIAAVLFVVGGFLLVSNSSNEDKKASDGSADTSQASTKKFSPPKACDIFTLDAAKKALGPTAQTSDNLNAPGAKSDDIEVSQCVYETPAKSIAEIRTQKQASLLVRGAKTDVGAKSNVDVFKGDLKPADTQNVDGYGEAAFWTPQFGQLNILKNNNWYILSVGPSAPTEKKLDEAKVMADAIISKL
jgi:hypothetical protein